MGIGVALVVTTGALTIPAAPAAAARPDPSIVGGTTAVRLASPVNLSTLNLVSNSYYNNGTFTVAGWGATLAGLGATYNRVLNHDCVGTVESSFQLPVDVTSADGRNLSADITSYLCLA